MNFTVVFEADVYDTDDVEKFYENLSESFPELEEESSILEDTKFKSVLVGNSDNFSEDDIEAIQKLTHHAECLYNDTSMELVHVEVIGL